METKIFHDAMLGTWTEEVAEEVDNPTTTSIKDDDVVWPFAV